MKTIMDMALEAGFEVDEDIANVWVSDAYIGDKLERFAALVRADEREAIESEGWCDTEIVIAAIKEALAQPERNMLSAWQETIAGVPVTFESESDAKRVMAYLAQPEQEPVAWWDAKLGVFEEKHFDQLQPLYTSPAQRPWVGLTNKERSELWWSTDMSAMPEHDYGKAIEAKLKEKNS